MSLTDEEQHVADVAMAKARAMADAKAERGERADDLMTLIGSIGQTYPFAESRARVVGECARCGCEMYRTGRVCDGCRVVVEKARRMAVPAGLAWATFGDSALAARVVAPDAIDAVKRNLASPRVVLVGPAGAGKSSLAVAALHELAREGRVEPRFAHAHRLGTARIQHAAGSGEAAYVERAMRAEWLLLDDLGSERQTANNAVPDVIFERHAEDRPTWVTTGFSPAEIAQKYGDGIARRVFERAVVVRLEGAKR